MGLFDEQVSRKPDLYPWTKDFMDAMWNGFWTANEFSFKSDYAQFKSELSPQEQQIVTRTLASIGTIEIAVKKFWAKLGDNLPHPSISDLGFVLSNQEVIHNRAYEKLLEVLGLDKIFEEILEEPVIKNRMEYLRKYLKKVYKDDSRKQYVYAIILFSLFVENISLYSQFYIIQNFNKYKNILKDTSNQVSYTMQEEGVHALVGIKIINTLRGEYPELFDSDLECRILEETAAAVDAEFKIVDWVLGDYESENLSAPILKTYLANRMNESLEQIGFKPSLTINQEQLEKSQWFRDEEFTNTKADFFHRRPIDYSKNTVTNDIDELF